MMDNSEAVAVSAPILTNPTDELEGLLGALQGACAGAITRAVTVRHRDYDGFYAGTYPLVVARLDTYQLTRISGGHTGLKGQQSTRQNTYTIEIQDVIRPRDKSAERVAAAQSDLYALIGAIAAWFDSTTHQTLPVAGQPTCTRAGESLAFKISRPFQVEDGGDVRLVAAGRISVIGIPRPGLDP